MSFVLKSFLIWRLLLFLPVFLATFFIPFRQNQEFTSILSRVSENSFLQNILIFPWANFDGVHFLSIAVNGYITEGRFLPLFPLTIKFLGFILGLGQLSYEGTYIAGFLISNLSLLLSLNLLYKIIKSEYSEEVARRALLFLLTFPTAFFLGSIYSESLFLLLSLLSFYFASKSKWFISSLSGMLLSSTRFLGIFILPALIYEFIQRNKKNSFTSGKNLFSLASFLIIPGLLVGFSMYCFYKWGDALYFLNAHGSLGNNRETSAIIIPLQTIYRYLKIFFQISLYQLEWWVALLEFCFFMLISILLFFAWKKGIKKSFLIFSIFAFLTPALSGNFTGLPRYSLVLFPIYIALALIHSKALQKIILVSFIFLQIILLMLFSRGYYIS